MALSSSLRCAWRPDPKSQRDLPGGEVGSPSSAYLGRLRGSILQVPLAPRVGSGQVGWMGWGGVEQRALRLLPALASPTPTALIGQEGTGAACRDPLRLCA